MNEVKEYLTKIGSKGGQATSKKYGKKHMSEIAKRPRKRKAQKIST